MGLPLVWGKFGGLVKPAPGNHEYYNSATADGYFSYFGTLAGSTPGYRAYDVPRTAGKWRAMQLNSAKDSDPYAYGNSKAPGCGLSGAQMTFLKNHSRTLRPTTLTPLSTSITYP